MASPSRSRARREARRRQAAPTAASPADSWILCDGCGLPFSLPGSVGWHVSSPEMQVHGLKLGPCPRCGATGVPMNVHTVTRDGVTVAGTTPAAALEFIETSVAMLNSGQTTPGAVVEGLRSFGGAFLEFADWIEAHPKFTAMVATILITMLPLLRDTAVDAWGGILQQVMEQLEKTGR